MNELIKNKKNILHYAREYMIIILIITLAIVTWIIEPKFASLDNLTNIMRQFGPLIMVALGMTFVIIAGFIDLSVAGTISLVAVVTISLIQPLGQIPALIIGILLGGACGALNSLIVLITGAKTQAQALFITYGMWQVYQAIGLIYTGGSTQHFKYIEVDYSVFTAIGKGTVGFISVSFIIFLVICAIMFIFQSKTYMGRAISLTGGNKTAARLSGVSVNKSIVSIFVINGMMAAIAAIILMSRVTTASPVIGQGYETQAILAVVLGGTALTGGKGSVLRTVLGTAMVILLSNCMNLLGVSPYMQYMMRGAVLLLVILFDNSEQI